MPKHSLMLNAYFQKLTDADSWNEEAILTRAEALLPIALKTWPHPGADSKA
jgi:hypothetical protein